MGRYLNVIGRRHIVVVPTTPYAPRTTYTSVSPGASMTFNMAAPAGIIAGDFMWTAIIGGSYGAGTTAPASAYHYPATWTPLYYYPSKGVSKTGFRDLYYKIADATDQAGTSSYQWKIDGVTNSLYAGSIIVAGWPAANGVTPTFRNSRANAGSLTVNPLDDWTFAVAMQRSEANATIAPNPTITTTHTDLGTNNANAGWHEGRERSGGIQPSEPSVAFTFSAETFSRELGVIVGIRP